eukprot:CAMPEP_0179311904 /NCGR_PEP_ID=MMETSP0797-20121207/52945_1 /TAXON_ID=47934 /ORGANISM="Dinophysis acuminata, Strain DAEP01" /LENGTH=93 /DNA_ID=CAMNT_0021021729 /DNA_START=161 /DNA_END=442 /DNA_ORIENTATION=-
MRGCSPRAAQWVPLVRCGPRASSQPALTGKLVVMPQWHWLAAVAGRPHAFTGHWCSIKRRVAVGGLLAVRVDAPRGVAGFAVCAGDGRGAVDR